jgi:DNA polymerase V
MHTMGDVARYSLTHEEQLYRLFGVNAELIIDHAWGWEPCTMKYIKAYKPQANSLGSGQVLQSAYTFEKALVVMKEMAEALSLDLVDKHLVTRQIVINIGYDRESLDNPAIASKYTGAVGYDYYGRKVPKSAHGTANLDQLTSSTRLIRDAVVALYYRITDPKLLVRRLNITACNIVDESEAEKEQHAPMQLDLFADNEALIEDKQKKQNELTKERKMQKAMLSIKKKFGKNAILKGLDFDEGATTKERNNQIGGHKA